MTTVELELGRAARTLLTIAFLATTSCGGSGSSDDDTGGRTGGGTTSNGGSGGAPGGSGGNAGTGTGVQPTPQTCDAQQGRVSVDGKVVSFPLVRAANIASANANSELWTWGTLIGTAGFFQLVGSGAVKGQMNQPVDGTPLTIDHGVLAPNIGDSLGTMYAVTSGSGSQLLRQGNQIDVELQGVAVLHDCGDYPVNGEIDLCHRADGSACPDSAQGGTLDQYDWTDDVTGWTLTSGDLSASLGSQGGSLRAHVDASGAGPLKWAVVSTSIYGHYDGKVLCAGDGSEAVTLSDATGDYTVVHLKNLAWLEGPGNERASGCLR